MSKLHKQKVEEAFRGKIQPADRKKCITGFFPPSDWQPATLARAPAARRPHTPRPGGKATRDTSPPHTRERGLWGYKRAPAAPRPCAGAH